MMTIEMTKVKKRVDGAAVGGKAHYLASKNGDLFQVSAAHERWKMRSRTAASSSCPPL